MREPYRLAFSLPPLIVVPQGRHQPCLHGCVLRIGPGGIVSIEGPSRELVFEQASRFLRIHLRNWPETSLAATLSTPARDRFGRPFPRRDGWQIICGAKIAFAATSVPAQFPAAGMPAQQEA